MYKKFYKSFLEHHKDKIHLAAHSHHFWPDITKQAMIDSWEDSAKYSDHKWDYIFENTISRSQSLIAQILNLTHSDNIAFAPNTHELLTRLFSCFQYKSKFKILTTTSEFHSLSRQLNRMNEEDSVEAIILDNEKEDFEDCFLKQSKEVDLIFISHVFFNSGKVLDFNFIKKIIKNKKSETILCLDGYHGFCAVETDLSSIEDDVFYLAGGYKYAQAGEGACFMTIPKGCKLRPVNTGWFADFASLAESSREINYSDNGMRFWGATQDLTPWYRFNSVWNLFSDEKISVSSIHSYIQSLQKAFIENIDNSHLILNKDLKSCGHFITFDLKDSKTAKALHDDLQSKKILTDFRGERLRFGFGMYLDQDDIKRACQVINLSLKELNII